MPDNANELQTGDKVLLHGEIQANDEQGISVALTSPMEKEVEEAPTAPPAGEQNPPVDDVPVDTSSPSASSATSYVRKKRAKMMAAA